MSTRYDLIILGGGPGGYVSAIRAGQLGLSTAVIEKDKIGGTCLHRGCIPTKALIRSAYLYSLFKESKDFGITADNIKFDWNAIQKRKNRVVTKLWKGTEFLLKKNKVSIIQGEGFIKSNDIVKVKDSNGNITEYQYKNLIIATGSTVKSLPFINIDGKQILNSDHLLEIDSIPSSLAIIGAGAIGVEFAYLFHSFGCKVTLIEVLPTLLPLEDKEIGEELEKVFTKMGIKCLPNTLVKNVNLVKQDSSYDNSIQDKSRITDEVQIDVQLKDGKNEQIKAEKLLVAVGRGPVSSNIGLEEVGIATEKGFINVNEFMQTNVPNIYAIGDVTGNLLLAHKASAEGILAVEKIAGKEVKRINYNNVPRATYSNPEVASVGLTEQQARAVGYEVSIGKFPFQANSKAYIDGDTVGFVKIVADKKTDKILGASIIGPHCTEFLGQIVAEMELGSAVESIERIIQAHPTISEVLKEAMHSVRGMPIHI